MNDSTKEKIKLLRTRFINKLPDKVSRIEFGWVELKNESSQKNIESFKLLVHNLRGTSATYDCIQISEITQKIEDELHHQKINYQEIEGLVALLRLELSNIQ